MKRVLALLAISTVVAGASTAELRRENVPMDRVPWELAEPSLTKPMWWDAPHIPSDHPYWWTLTDELSPQELRKKLSERQTAVRREARAELEKVKRSAGESSTGREEVEVWFLRGDEHAELFPAWDAFYSFAVTMVGFDEKDKREEELKKFGLSAFASRQIVESAAEVAEEAEEFHREGVREAQRLRKLLDDVAARLPPEQVRQMKAANDVGFLAAATGVEVNEVRKLTLRVQMDSKAAAAVPALVSLRAAIGEEQWKLLRRYLLEEVAPHDFMPLTFSLDEAL
jgi:hypothetical protein